GAGRWQVLSRVTLPLLRPALAGAALLVFMTALGSFSAPYVFGGGFRVMTTQIVATKLNGELPLAMVETVALALVAVVGLAVLRRPGGVAAARDRAGEGGRERARRAAARARGGGAGGPAGAGGPGGAGGAVPRTDRSTRGTPLGPPGHRVRDRARGHVQRLQPAHVALDPRRDRHPAAARLCGAEPPGHGARGARRVPAARSGVRRGRGEPRRRPMGHLPARDAAALEAGARSRREPGVCDCARRLRDVHR